MRSDAGARDALTEFGDGPGAVGTERAGQRDPRIKPLRDEEIAPVQRRGGEPHQDLPTPGTRLRDLLDAQVLGAADLV